MAKKTNRTFEVTGQNHFPLDMLRYDACFPARSDDVANMSIERHCSPVTIRLITNSESIIKMGPQEARWKSFGWIVTNNNKL